MLWPPSTQLVAPLLFSSTLFSFLWKIRPGQITLSSHCNLESSSPLLTFGLKTSSRSTDRGGGAVRIGTEETMILLSTSSYIAHSSPGRSSGFRQILRTLRPLTWTHRWREPSHHFCYLNVSKLESWLQVHQKKYIYCAQREIAIHSFFLIWQDMGGWTVNRK